MPRRSLMWGAVAGIVGGAVFLLFLALLRSSFAPAPPLAGAAMPVARSAGTVVKVGLRDVPCWFEIPADHPTRCGILTVPERWDAPHSHALHLKFVVFRATAVPALHPEPILYLSGGPGEPARIDAASIGGWWSWIARTPWLKDRDVVVFDPRGVGLSEPSMTCPELAAAGYRVFVEPLSLAAATRLWSAAAQRCHDRLAKSGLDLAAYNTAAMVADLHALITQLGYRSWDLLAVSFGTRVALSFLDRWPEGTHVAILDSVWPVSVAADVEDVRGTADAFAQLFRNCAEDAACRASFPDLAQTFADVVRRAAVVPVPVRVPDPRGGPPVEAQLDDGKLIEVLFYAFYDWRRIAALPATIAALAAGNTAPLAGLARTAFANYVSDRLSYGLYLSVECHDQFPAEGVAAVEHAAAAFPLYRDFALSNLAVAACPSWPVGAASAETRAPAGNDVPILMLSGELDPITPPRWARAAAAHRPRAVVIAFPGVGHGVLQAQECASLLVGRFLQDPAKPPFDPCLLGLRPPQFRTASTGG